MDLSDSEIILQHVARVTNDPWDLAEHASSDVTAAPGWIYDEADVLKCVYGNKIKSKNIFIFYNRNMTHKKKIASTQRKSGVLTFLMTFLIMMSAIVFAGFTTTLLSSETKPVIWTGIKASRWSGVDRFTRMWSYSGNDLQIIWSLVVSGSVVFSGTTTAGICPNSQNLGKIHYDGTCFMGCTPSWWESLNKSCLY